MQQELKPRSSTCAAFPLFSLYASNRRNQISNELRTSARRVNLVFSRKPSKDRRGKMDEQAQAASYIRKILLGRGYDITYRTIILEDNQKWLVFELDERQIAIDTASGVWGKASSAEIWRCVSKTCTTSAASLAAEILLGD